MPDDAARRSDTIELGRGETVGEPASGLVPGLGSAVPPAAVSSAPPAPSSAPPVSHLPSAWLDRLLLLDTSLPLDDGAEATLRAVVQTLAVLLPECRVAARLGAGETSRAVYTEAPAGAVASVPPVSNEQLRSDRLFPGAAHERIVPLASEPGWLHLAGERARVADDLSVAVLLLERAAIVADSGLRQVREREKTAKLLGELKAFKGYMVQAEKLASLGQMAAGIVHELNNPLTSIVAYTDFMLRRAERFDEPDTERIRRIAESANRMLRFTRDLVSYARPSSELAIPVPLHAVVRRALAFCEHEIAVAGVAVDLAFDDRVNHVRGKPEDLAQVFVNLVTNACHAMAKPPDASGEREPPRLTITTELTANDAAVRVVVEDTGHGITSAHIPLVFAPFFTTKGAGQGTGLGLSIVKNIVEAHRGEISVESETSTGTRFVLLLPVE